MPKSSLNNNNQAAWSGLVLVVVTLMLIGVYFLRMDSTELVSYDIDPNLVVYKTNIADAASESAMTEYRNKDYSFIVNYPISSQLTTRSSSEGELEIFTVDIEENNNIVSVNVMAVEMEGVVKSSINIDNEEEIMVDSNTATRIDGTSVKDGSDNSMVIIENNNNIITIEGTGQNFEDVVSYFEII